MDTKSRMLKAWDFQEPDRVPLELGLSPGVENLPGAEEMAEFIEKEGAKFCGVPGFNWGFMGIDSSYHEEVLTDDPGNCRRILRTHSTPAGDFTAVTRHLYDDLYGGGDPSDFHWEKRYFENIDDLRRVAEAKRENRPFAAREYNAGCARVGTGGVPSTGLFHPLGNLVRNSNMAEVYMWMVAEEKLIMKDLERCTEQGCDTLQSIRDENLSDPPVFMTYALEMLIPPWLGTSQFDTLVVPFDQKVNDAIHAIGGRHRAHCHGRCAGFLERFADMGIDGVEPLEPPPYGDVSLSRAKQQVGTRMLLAGNIPSQAFYLESFKPSDVRRLVQCAIDEGAPGGGFFLKTTGGSVGNGKNQRQRIKSLECGLALVDAWREFGSY